MGYLPTSHWITNDNFQINDFSFILDYWPTILNANLFCLNKASRKKVLVWIFPLEYIEIILTPCRPKHTQNKQTRPELKKCYNAGEKRNQ